MKRQCLFLRSKDKQTPSTRMSPPQQVNTDGQRSHSAMVEDSTF